jgi:holo-[acyl-carrier protein] synthase
MEKIFPSIPFLKTGVDIAEIGRMKALHQKWGDKFLERVFDQEEIDYCMNKSSRYAHLAGRFASKEAVIKILKTHISPPLKTIRIIRGSNGEPLVSLLDEAAEMASAAGITGISISISHSGDFAVAFAIAHYEKIQ